MRCLTILNLINEFTRDSDIAQKRGLNIIACYVMYVHTYLKFYSTTLATHVLNAVHV